MQLLRKYFPDLDQTQYRQFEKLLSIVPALNQRINVISRNDVKFLEERHILHSLAIAKKFNFQKDSSIMDVGTGGGFPGIPLAIVFPGARFLLVDSIGKKVQLVQEISQTLGLSNVTVIRARMENLDQKVDYVVSRAVSSLPKLSAWTQHLIRPPKPGNMASGLISLKGGDLDEELKPFGKRVELYPISALFEEPFFYTKMIVFLKK